MASFFRQTPLPSSSFKLRVNPGQNQNGPGIAPTKSPSHSLSPTTLSTPSTSASISRRISRTDLDFEQALKGGGTVLIKEGFDIQSLGKSPSSTGHTPTTATSASGFPRFNTPIVVPPTPSPQSQQPPPIVDISAAEDSDADIDLDLQTKRRSMFRSPGTSSSPDLATLVRKAKERGGVIGGGSSGDNPEESLAPQSSSSLLAPQSSSETGRLRANSATSSSFSVISSSSDFGGPKKNQGKGYKPEKVLGYDGGGLGHEAKNRDQPKTVRSTMKTRTTAFFGKMMGQGTVRDKFPSSPSTSAYIPPPDFSGAQKREQPRRLNETPSSPPPRLYAAFATTSPRPTYDEKQQPVPPPNDVFSTSPNLTKPLPPIYRPRGLLQDSEDEDEDDSGAPVRSGTLKGPPSTPAGLAKARERDRDAKTASISSSIKQNRRRSMSVSDVVVVSPASPPSESLSLKPSISTSSSSEWMGDIDIGDTATDFSGAFAGLTAPDSSPAKRTPRSRGTGRPSVLEYAKEQSFSRETPHRSDTIRSSQANPRTPSDLDTSNLSLASYTTGRTSPSVASENFFTPPTGNTSLDHPLPPTPNPNNVSPPPKRSQSTRSTLSPVITTSPAANLVSRRRPSSTTTSPTTNPRVNALRQYSSPRPASPSSRNRRHLTSPSHESLRSIVQPRSSASNSEPALVNNSVSPSSYPRLSLSTEVDDEDDKNFGTIRTVRLVPSGNGLGLGLSAFDDLVSQKIPNRTNSLSKPANTTGAGMDEEELAERGKDLADKCWNEDESFLGREKIAEWLGGMDKIKKVALKHYIDFFDFGGLRLDNAFRHLCAKLYLKAETQQVDRILEEFSRRYYECNPNCIYGSVGVVHQVCYSLLLLNTDLHVAELASHMSRSQFVRNTLDTIRSQVQEGHETHAFVNGNAGRVSTPDLRSHDDATSVHSVHVGGSDGRGSLSDSGTAHTVRTRPRRSESITSKKSSSHMSSTQPTSQLNSSTNSATTSSSDFPELRRVSSQIPSGSVSVNNSSITANRNWEAEMEAMLKDMYSAVKSQQILQPLVGNERPSLSPGAPHGQVLHRSRSQRSNNPPDRLATLKRGSIRGLQTLLGSQSPYGSNSSGSIDGRVSPAPSFATSIGDGIYGYGSTSTLFTPTLGFASNLSHSIIKEAQEDDLRSIDSDDTGSTNVSITDEELALLGPPWAKEGMLSRKQFWESTGKRAKNKTWMDVFVVIQKGELSMFTFGEGTSGASAGAGAGVGGGNWLSNANPVGEVVLAHSLAHPLPTPGYKRPHCFVLTLSSGAVYFFQAGTEDLVNEWVSTCNYWAARQSREPLSGGVSNMEYGWNRVLETYQDDSDAQSDSVSLRSGRSKLSKKGWGGSGSVRAGPSPFTMEKIYINEWKPPLPPTIASTHDEEAQLEALQKQATSLKNDLKTHNELQKPMLALYPSRSSNAAKALGNWERKSQHLLAEIVKYDSYVESLRHAMSLRLKKRGERVLERALIVSSPDEKEEHSDGFLFAPSGAGKGGFREETIHETEEPVTPVPKADGKFPAGAGTLHRRESAGVDVKE